MDQHVVEHSVAAPEMVEGGFQPIVLKPVCEPSIPKDVGHDAIQAAVRFSDQAASQGQDSLDLVLVSRLENTLKVVSGFEVAVCLVPAGTTKGAASHDALPVWG